MHLSSRSATEADIDHFFNYGFLAFGVSLQVRNAMSDLWTSLIGRPCVDIILVVDQERPQNDSVVAVGGGAFIDPRFAEWIRSGTSPRIWQELGRRLGDRSSPILSYNQMMEANSKGGIIGLQLLWGWRNEGLRPEEQLALIDYLSIAFSQRTRGHRYRELLVPAMDERSCTQLNAIGYLRRTDYVRYKCAVNTPGVEAYALYGMTREEATATGAGMAARVFQYQPPRFNFSLKEQKLLCGALEGLSDEQIAEAADLTLSAIKKRWLSIFDRVSAVYPNLFADEGFGVRGPEKRTALMRYLAIRPEELRPHRRP